MTTEDRAALRKLAEEATPGPWAWSNKEWRVSASDMWAVAHYEERCAALDADDYDAPGMYHEPIIQTDSGAYGPRESDREYIAAANPQVVLRLLDEIDRLEKERDGSCIQCRMVFVNDSLRCWYGAGEVGPLCERCDEVIKLHTGFTEQQALREQLAALEAEASQLPPIVEEIEVCLGCGRPTASERDCGCPAGSGVRKRRPEDPR